MTITHSLAYALSGLTAAARSAEVVSANVANATTEGYGKRELMTSTQSLAGQGGGVSIDGIRRVVDEAVLSDRRQADAGAANAETRAAFYTKLEAAVGLPDDPASVSGRIAALEASLVEAASRPDSDTRLAQVLAAAENLTTTFAAVTDEIQSLREDADAGIAAQVAQLNDRLAKIDDLNEEIRVALGRGRDAAALMDQRQVLLDDISSIIPLRVVESDFSQISLYSTNGMTLLDVEPAKIEFSPVGEIVPEMSLDSGALSGLTVNGQPIRTSGNYAPIAGGSLAALFQQRDELAPAAQAELDAVARDIVERLQSSAVDPTLGGGDAGLFTDAGAAFSGAGEVGLAGRLTINAAVDPAQGGAVWHLRSGIGATVPNDPGVSTVLQAMADALTAARQPNSGQFTTAARSASALAAEFLSYVGMQRQSAEADQSYAMAKQSALKTEELADGIDTDEQLQKLLMVEQAYSANARVIQAVDEMIQTLLGL